MSGSKRIIVAEITASGLKGKALVGALAQKLNSASQPATAPVKPASIKGKKK